MAPYLGYGDVVELQSQLVHINLSFATEITEYQEHNSDLLMKILDYIASLVEYPIKPSEYIVVTMVPPVVLILQLIEMTSSSAQNIISTFQNLQLPIDPIGFLREYVPFLDWNKFEKAALKFTAEKSIDTEVKSKNDAKLPTSTVKPLPSGRGYKVRCR